jgi:wyosine [tRNA(Phe)-imidazoG37] synthetase (radical SAM superfamily)
MAYRFVFGPVHSRRMGYSLGIDPVPRKTCSMDCIYCEVGPTDKWTMERREWVPVGDILEEVRRKLAEQHRIDVITFSGSGEPVLHSGLGALIDGIRRMTDLPIAVLTNGSYMDDAAVRADLARADIVVPSLDAVTPEVFQAINRPHRKLHLEDVIAGLKAFRKEFQGKLWLEVLLVEGVNDSDEDVKRLAAVAAEIEPDRIDLNTVVRPPACEGVRGVSGAAGADPGDARPEGAGGGPGQRAGAAAGRRRAGRGDPGDRRPPSGHPARPDRHPGAQTGRDRVGRAGPPRGRPAPGEAPRRPGLPGDAAAVQAPARSC